VNSSPEISPAKSKWVDFSNKYVRPLSKQGEVSFNIASDSHFSRSSAVGGINLRKINVNPDP